MEEVEIVDIVGAFGTGHAQHQNEIQEALGGVAALDHALVGDIGEDGIDIPVAQPLDRLPVEYRIGTGFHELARAAEFERQVAGSDRGDALV